MIDTALRVLIAYGEKKANKELATNTVAWKLTIDNSAIMIAITDGKLAQALAPPKRPIVHTPIWVGPPTNDLQVPGTATRRGVLASSRPTETFQKPTEDPQLRTPYAQSALRARRLTKSVTHTIK